MSIKKLLSIAPPPNSPQETGSSKAWGKIDQRLGVNLPQDYKDFIDYYGTGTFNETFTVYNPFAGNESLNLFHALETHHRANEMVQLVVDSPWTAIHPFELYPAANGLLPWGTTTNFEEILFWQVNGTPKNWATVFYNLRLGEYEVWKMSCTNFLVGIFSGAIQSVLLAENFLETRESIQFCPHDQDTL